MREKQWIVSFCQNDDTRDLSITMILIYHLLLTKYKTNEMTPTYLRYLKLAAFRPDLDSFTLLMGVM